MMSMSGKVRMSYYEELGDKFEVYMSDYDVERRVNLMFSVLIDPDQIRGRRVLEIGSGTGRISSVVVRVGGELTILDVGPRLVSEVVGALNCEGMAADAQKLAIGDDLFDLVVSSECIEHTLEPELAIREMCRVCKPGGIVCLTTPNKLWYPVMRAAQRLGARKYDGIENWLCPGQAVDVMKGEGMVDVTVSGCHLWPFQIRPLRPLLKRVDAGGKWLYPLMINFGVAARKV
jgi:2-polyprenyl-6-hydroxyphenyl methylase/3-demethylubiquinone-9 3-methyltransferase